MTSSTPAAQTATSSLTICADLVVSLDGDAARVVDLERLGSRERQVEPVGEGLRERPAAEGEHARPLDAALPDERDVGRAAADVDEQRAGLPDLVATRGTRATAYGSATISSSSRSSWLATRLQRAEVHERRERVEDADLHVAALEPDRVGDRVAVDRGAGHGRVHEPDVDVGQARSPR